MGDYKHKILIVDDAIENVKMISAILNEAGFNTTSAHDGISALRLTHKQRFDMILLDIMMPELNGIDTCQYLRVDSINTDTPVIFLTASDEKEMLVKAYQSGGVDYIKKPFFKEELLTRINSHLQLREYKQDLERKVEQKTREIAETQIQLMYMLGGIAEGHSIETHLHVKRVSEFTHLLATLYGMDAKEAKMLKDASALHDLGKLGITDTILHKEGKLTAREFKEIKRHAGLGAKMISGSELPLLKTAAIVCRQHHERYDGSGYPEGLEGEQIHIYGRIVAAADVFDALLFRRSYKHGWSIDEVVAYFKENRGKHFDPDLVDIITDNLDAFLKIYGTKLEQTEKYATEKKAVSKLFGWLVKTG